MVRQRRPEGGLRVVRGDVWLAALDPTIGSEIQKTRPCLIVSPAEMPAVLLTWMAVSPAREGKASPELERPSR